MHIVLAGAAGILVGLAVGFVYSVRAKAKLGTEMAALKEAAQRAAQKL